MKLKILNTTDEDISQTVDEALAWFLPHFPFDVTIEDMPVATIPFSRDRISPKWIQRNVRLRGEGYDIVAIVVPPSKWKSTARGRRHEWGNPVSIEVHWDTQNHIYATGRDLGTVAVEALRHELLHALFAVQGGINIPVLEYNEDNSESAYRLIDTTHYYTQRGIPERALIDLATHKKTPIQSLMNFLKRFFSSKDELLPKVADRRDRLVKAMELSGYPVTVTSQYRSFEEQSELYAQGRTAPGNIVTNARAGESFHNYRVAFDIAFLENGHPSWAEHHPWDILGMYGKLLGLEWGGDWTFPDRPHFEYKAGHTLADFQEGNIDYTKFN